MMPWHLHNHFITASSTSRRICVRVERTASDKTVRLHLRRTFVGTPLPLPYIQRERQWNQAKHYQWFYLSGTGMKPVFVWILVTVIQEYTNFKLTLDITTYNDPKTLIKEWNAIILQSERTLMWPVHKGCQYQCGRRLYIILTFLGISVVRYHFLNWWYRCWSSFKKAHLGVFWFKSAQREH